MVLVTPDWTTSQSGFLIFHYQQRGFRRESKFDRQFLVIPMGAAVVPKSFVIILLLVAWVYSMMGGNLLLSAGKVHYCTINSSLCHPKKIVLWSLELRSVLKAWSLKSPAVARTVRGFLIIIARSSASQKSYAQTRKRKVRRVSRRIDYLKKSDFILHLFYQVPLIPWVLMISTVGYCLQDRGSSWRLPWARSWFFRSYGRNRSG
jgi:hypothetical protein